jgi:glycosyltransferase involved in cell wall biosynthesis
MWLNIMLNPKEPITVQRRERLKIVWLTSYPVADLAPRLGLDRVIKGHPCSWTVNLAAEISKLKGLDLHIVSAYPGIRENKVLFREGVTFHVVRYAIPFTLRGFPSYLPLDVLSRYGVLRLRIRRILDELAPDLIHVFGTEYGYGLAALDSLIPTLISMQGLIAFIKDFDRRFVLTLQSSIEAEVIQNSSFFASATAWATNYIRSQNRSAVVFDLPEAINRCFFSAKSSLRTKDVVCVGRLCQYKGLETAIKAMTHVLKSHPSCRLLVVGTGDRRYTIHLKDFARKNGVAGGVQFLGAKSPFEIASIHMGARMLVHPSLVDNSPNSIIEGMAMGLPVIASNVGGIPSLIKDAETGLLIEPGDPQQLADCINYLLEDNTRCRSMGRAARKVALQRNHPTVVGATAFHIYNNLVHRDA